MKSLYLTFIFLLLVNVCAGQQDQSTKYDFDETEYEFSTHEELIKSFIKCIESGDSATIVKHSIPKEGMFFFLEQLSIYQPQAQNIDKAIEATEHSYERGLAEFLKATKNLRWYLNYDSVSICNAEIISIEYSPEDRLTVGPNLMAGSITAKLLFNDKEYSLSIPHAIKLKNKWFILGANFKWGEHSVDGGLTIEQLTKMAEEAVNQKLKRAE